MGRQGDCAAEWAVLLHAKGAEVPKMAISKERDWFGRQTDLPPPHKGVPPGVGKKKKKKRNLQSHQLLIGGW